MILEDRAIAVLVSEAAGDALFDFVMLAAWMDPANMTRAEP